MKLHLTPIAIAFSLLFNTALLIGEQTQAIASQESPITPSQAQSITGHLIRPRSGDFFRQGRQMMEGEIQRLLQRQNASSEPILENNVNIEQELDRLPQLQPDTLNEPSVDS